MSHFKGEVAVVTGVSHAEGIGAAICRELASDGVDIFFTYWEAASEWPQTFQRELQDFGVHCEYLLVDLSESTASSELLDAVETKLALPSILVNNAAYSTRDGYLAFHAEELDNHYAVNMRATFLLSVEFARRFQKAGKTMGRIINMTSGQAQGPMVGELAYVATKGAISAFTLSLSAELAPLGITVNAVNPGPTDSGWMSEKVKQELSPQFLIGRIGQPSDASRLIAFLASDKAEWITGQVINSEGGFLRS